jgi:hypothetical protein
MRTCEMENCENKHEAKGFCVTHYTRYKKYGDPNFLHHEQRGGNYNHRPAEGTWGTYNKIHRRMYRYYGSASEFDCSVCYEPAQTWALVKEWVPEGQLLWGVERGFDVPYSLDPGHYLTLCKAHHNKLDKGVLEVG